MATRSPICTIVGHVDHGKTSILDRIRGTAVTATEAGKITQAIGASIVPLDVIKKICGTLLEQLHLRLTIPGLLFIDTPGHAAFINLRKRGGALADIAVLVVDINEGFKPQTLESIEILKSDKTPFIVAANKLDLVQGWQGEEKALLQNINQQAQRTKEVLDTKLYELVGKLHELGFASERFDRVDDYTKQIAIIPVSAHTGEGIPELLMVLAGLAQKFLKLEVEVKGPAKGTVLEVKEEKGLGVIVDVIVYDGTLRVNDPVVIGGLDKAIVTKVRALLEPFPLTEMRIKKAKFRRVNEVFAATGVKIAAPELNNVIAGMPLRSVAGDVDNAAQEIQQEVKEVLIETDEEGLVIKADTLGSLEAMIVLLKESGIPIKSASVGKISKTDITDAEVSGNENPFYGVLLAFNTSMLPDAEAYAEEKDVKVILHDVIYRLIDAYKQWKEEKKQAMELAELDKLVRGGKFRILSGYVFRQSNPAVVGVEVLSGRLKSGESVMTPEGRKLTVIKCIQEEKENVAAAQAGKQVAVSMDGVIVGRQIHESDTLYIDVPEEDFRKMKELKHYLDRKDVELLKEIAEIKRKGNPVWGI
ncbi:translation initiation factor IF-2 [Candidatus Woesearchaeota archaeon]|nr:translation initiation factor IF-2 [Candidatus Woesearchaeota archaeon]